MEYKESDSTSDTEMVFSKNYSPVFCTDVLLTPYDHVEVCKQFN